MDIRHDLFLSYRRTDAQHVSPLVDALVNRGVTVWQDTREIDDHTSIEHAIKDGLAHVRALLVWYSREYNASPACRWELTTAYLTAQASGADPRRRVLIVNPETSTKHIVLPDLRDQLHLNPAQWSIDELARRIADKLDNREHGVPAEPLGSLQPLERPTWHGSAGLGSKDFVGRLYEMWQIHDRLQSSHDSMLIGQNESGRRGLVQLTGLGGMGKSLLAEEYARRFEAAYPGGIFWLKAYGYSDHPETPQALDATMRDALRDDQMLTLAEDFNLDIQGLDAAQVRKKLHQRIEQNGKPFLWIIDDLPPTDTQTLLSWLAPSALGRTLITTRAHQIGFIHSIDLPPLDQGDALQLLTRNQPLSVADQPAAQILCAELGHHALALAVTAALITRRGCQQVLDDLRRSDRDVLEFAAEIGEALPMDHKRSIAATLLRSVSELDTPARDLLRLASALAVAPIPHDLQWRPLASADALHDDDARDLTDKAADQLINASLAKNGNDGDIAVHALVRRTINFHDAHAARIKALRDAAINVLLAELPKVEDIRSHAALNRWIPHARYLGAEPHDEATTEIFWRLGRYDLSHGSYAQAASEFSKAARLLERLSGEYSPYTLHARYNQAIALSGQGRWVEAHPLQVQLLRSMQKIYGEHHVDAITALDNLATTLCRMGRHSEAYELQEQVVAKRIETLGMDDLLTLSSQFNLAATLGIIGKTSQAHDLEIQVLEKRRIILGKDHPDTLLSEHGLAISLHNLGKTHEALDLMEITAVSISKIFGVDHPETIRTSLTLANFYLSTGNLENSLSIYCATHEKYKIKHGDYHFITLEIASKIGENYYHQARFTEAAAQAKKVLEARKIILPKNHPDILDSMRCLANALSGHGDLLGAEDIELSVVRGLQEIHGKDHIDTLCAMHNLCITFARQGKLNTARALQEKVLIGLRDKCGNHHPKTKEAIMALANILQLQGNITESTTLLTHLSESSQSNFNENPREAISSMNILAASLHTQCRFWKAKQYQEKALSICHTTIGHDDPLTIETQRNIAITHTLIKTYPISFFYFFVRWAKLQLNRINDRSRPIQDR